MKLLKLEIYNLASLAAVKDQPQVIDFATGALAETGLAAITGPTGAGKSTILDALCLALFNEVPRLRTAHQGQEGKLADGSGAALNFNDKRSMLTRGTVMGYAKVSFATHDRKRYRVEWQVQRARKRLDGSLQKISRSLIDLDTGTVLASQLTEVGQLTQQLIGMNFEQFTRAVLLAQSEFGAFLKANDNERASLLECLTDTHIYSRLGQLADQQHKDAKKAYERLSGELKFVEPLPIEQRTALDQQKQQLSDQKQQLEQQIKQYQQREAWHQRDAELAEQCQAAEQALQQAQHDWQQLSAARGDQLRLKHMRPLRPHLEQRDRLLAEQTTGQQTLEQATQKLSNIDQACRQAEQDLDQRQMAEQQQQAYAKQIQPILAQAQADEYQCQTLREQFKQLKSILVQSQAHTEQLTQQLTQQQTAFDQYHQQQQQIEQDLAQTQCLQGLDQHPLAMLTEQLNTAATQHTIHQQAQQQQQQLEQQVDQIRQQRQMAAQQLADHQRDYGDDATLKQQLKDLISADLAQQKQLHQDQVLLQQFSLRQSQQASHAQLVARIEQTQQQQQSVLQAVSHAEQHRNACQQQHQQLEQLWQRQRQMSQQSVEQLRAHLHDDEACPVCGSTEHPYRQAGLAIAEAMVHETERDVQQARTQFDQAVAQLSSVQAEQRHLTQRLTELEQHASEAIQQIKQQDQQRHDQFGSSHGALLALAGDQAIQQLQQRITQTEQTQQQQQQHRLLVEQRNDEREQLSQHDRQQHDQLQASHVKLHEISSTAKDAFIQAHAAERTVLAQLPLTEQQQWQAAIDQQRVNDQAAQWCEQLTQRHRQLQQREQLTIGITEQQQRIKDSQLELAHHQQVQQQQQDQHDAVMQQGKQRRDQLNHALAQAQGPMESVQAWQDDLATRAQALQAQHQQATLALQHRLTEQKHTNEQILALQQQQHNIQQALDQCQTAISAWYGLYPEMTEAEVVRLLQLDSAQIEQMDQAIAACGDALTRIETQAQHHQQNRQAHQRQQMKHGLDEPMSIAQITQTLSDLDDQLKMIESDLINVIGHIRQDETRHQQAVKLGQSISAAMTTYQRWARLADPIGCATGAKFRKIAQGYQLDLLLAQANQQLQQLSRRYQLERAPESLGLLVIDRDMGDERRSVHSLSGGESFLVSLALALGLSGMAQGSVQIEALFIDEGFGTLDPESLQIVMDALDQLQAQGRKVIVITHVQEMQERIPVQIRVERVGLGHSQIRLLTSGHQQVA
jgi:exonuclease SbcC